MVTPTLDKLYSIKESVFSKFQIDRLIRPLVSVGVTPNKISLLGIVIGFLSVFFLFHDHTTFVILYVTNRLLDILDGYMARKFKLITDVGERLDHFGDLAVHAGFLTKTILFSDLNILATIALITYLGEYVLLKKQNLLHKKFPSGIFAFLYLFSVFKFALLYQIVYQIGSYIYFQLRMKHTTMKV